MTKVLFFTDLPDALSQHMTDCASPDMHVSTHRADLRDPEKQALLRAAERVTQSSRRHRRQHLILTDSQVMLGVAQKGRSSRAGLSRFARHLAALSLGYRQVYLFRWISTNINPADGPSRSFGR